MGKKERKRENKLRGKETVQVEEKSHCEHELPGRFCSSVPCVSLHTAVHHCWPGSHWLPEKESRHRGMEERAQPAPAGWEGQGKLMVEAAVQRRERWLALCESDREEGAAACHPVPQYLFF